MYWELRAMEMVYKPHHKKKKDYERQGKKENYRKTGRASIYRAMRRVTFNKAYREVSGILWAILQESEACSLRRENGENETRMKRISRSANERRDQTRLRLTDPFRFHETDKRSQSFWWNSSIDNRRCANIRSSSREARDDTREENDAVRRCHRRCRWRVCARGHLWSLTKCFFSARL